ncbi:uncharacterized protein BDR25DRAFT_361593 [Lindgomyces ingoldianus]|uniref:Uncharacterized protein n=1 Tax=Lindgomyces ingoldianus TaxID=673940 RepID=A0ACB6QC92_9PLEO|nr:uncharacterized protein BDR25DRAFT_361593 [Lindgomyces ingoldianus]KAF2464516.1 hypothetical protein BDR25DRAFT_361593 [Lindgomyces ingoldianus]
MPPCTDSSAGEQQSHNFCSPQNIHASLNPNISFQILTNIYLPIVYFHIQIAAIARAAMSPKLRSLAIACPLPPRSSLPWQFSNKPRQCAKLPLSKFQSFASRAVTSGLSFPRLGSQGQKSFSPLRRVAVTCCWLWLRLHLCAGAVQQKESTLTTFHVEMRNMIAYFQLHTATLETMVWRVHEAGTVAVPALIPEEGRNELPPALLTSLINLNSMIYRLAKSLWLYSAQTC